MKAVLSVIFVFVAFNVSASSFPIYGPNTNLEKYSEEVGGWLGDRFKRGLTEVDHENYKQKTTKYWGEYAELVKQSSDPDYVLMITDETLDDISFYSREDLGVSLQDWLLFANPPVEDGASQRSKDIAKGITSNICQFFSVDSVGYWPCHFRLKIRYLLEDQSDIYAHVMTNSKFKALIADEAWLQRYNREKEILAYAKLIANENILHPEAKQLPKQTKSKSRDDVYKVLQQFKVIRNSEVVGRFNKEYKSLSELLILVEQKKMEDFLRGNSRIESMIRGIAASEKQLSRTKEYNLKNPNTQWSQDDEVRYQKILDDRKQALADYKKELAQNYANDVSLLKEAVIKEEGNQDSNALTTEKYLHNVSVFLKTLKDLDRKDYKFPEIRKVLCDDSSFSQSTLKKSDHEKLSFSEQRCFEEYLTVVLAR